MPDVNEEFADDFTPTGVGERTGVPAVDRVLASVESVGEVPLAARVEVFERAHDELRRALDAHPTSDVARG